MKIFAPGKCILSGEHAVVYGHPALAMAVDRHAVTTIATQADQRVSFHLPDLREIREFTLSTLLELQNRIKNNYHRFLQGTLNIRDVLQTQTELVPFVMSLCLPQMPLTEGLQVKLHSTIPIGSGMGSSAATILSIIYAMSQHRRLDFSKEAIYQLALEAENMQHGQSSGIDLQVSLYGGACYFHENKRYARPLPTVPLFLVNTGMPSASTGECVAHAATYFKTSQIGRDFAAVTQAMETALREEAELLPIIRANHRLLAKIGVVPDKVQQFILALEKMGGAAKISGAGSMSGETAGLLLVMIDNSLLLQSLCEQYGYSILSIQGEARGIHVGV